MTDLANPRSKSLPIASLRLSSLRTLGALAALTALAAILWALEPRFDLILEEPPVVQSHLYGAVGAFALGAILLGWRKGRLFHRVFGWIWTIAVGAATLSSAFIMSEDTGTWSWIHSMTVLTGLTLPVAVYFAKRHNVMWHRRLMLFLYFAMISGAALLAFIPDRLMWRVFFGN